MKSLEQLIVEYPDKTGAELLEIQQQSKSDIEKHNQLVCEQVNQKQLNFIKENNDCYFKGSYGDSQKFMYHVRNMEIINNEIVGSVRSVVYFSNNIEIKDEYFESISKYALYQYDKIEKSEWDKVFTYIKNIEQFWK